MGALLPCGSRDSSDKARPTVDLAAAWRRAAEVPPLPGPSEELEELLGPRWPGPHEDTKTRYETIRKEWSGRCVGMSGELM